MGNGLPPVKAQGGKSNLPSLIPISKPRGSVDVKKVEEQKKEIEENLLALKVEPIEEQKTGDSLADRKKRLLAQREKLLATKKQQRTEELKRYEEIKGGDTTAPQESKKELTPQKTFAEEKQNSKRSEIYAMMKK